MEKSTMYVKCEVCNGYAEVINTDWGWYSICLICGTPFAEMESEAAE
jgi:hypothetical protein